MTPPGRPTCQRCGEAVSPGARFCMKCGADVSGEQGSVATTVLPAAQERDPMEEVVEVIKKSTIGEYEILRELGRGGMASVYLAHDIALDRKVAIKVMSPALLMMGEGMVERFRREARTAANLSHPHIIPIYTVKSSGKALFFVMKFVAGRSLEAIIKDLGPMPVAMVKAILQQVAGALGYAHRSGIVHRDIKPANIMIDEEGWSVVTDFGIAKVAENRGLTMTGIAVGTPSYMSPEQCAAKDITGKSDQYSLGVVAYEMLTGHQPFQGDSAMAIMFAHFHEQPPPLKDARADAPPDLAALVMRMLEKAPDKRWGSMEELVTALHAPPLAHDDPVRLQLVELARRGGGRQLLDTLPPPPSSPVPPARGRPSTEDATTPIPVNRVVDLAIAPSRGEVYLGDAMQFTATPRNASGATTAASVNWASNNPAVASISSSGLLTGHAAGSATVTATCDGVSATAEIAVSVVPVGTVLLEPREVRVAEGEEQELRVTIKDRRGGVVRGRPVRWSTSAASVAVVDEQGRLSAVKEGTAEVIAECDGVRGSAKVAVTVAPVASVGIQPATPTVLAGQTITLTSSLADSRGRPLGRREVTWRSSNEKVASVSPTGLVSGLHEGTAEITAASEGKQATVTLRVAPAPVASVTVAAPAPVQVGSTIQLAAVVKDARGQVLTGREVKWSSAVSAIATVSDTGTLTALTPGSVKVTASCEGHSWTISVGVIPVPVAEVKIDGAGPLVVGGSGALTAAVTDVQGQPLSGRQVTWSSDSPRVVSVSSGGQITAKGPGSATLRAKVEGKEAQVVITVEAPAPREVPKAKVEVPPPPATNVEPVATAPAVSERPSTRAPRSERADVKEPEEGAAAPSGGKGKLIGAVAGVLVIAVAGFLLLGRGASPDPGAQPSSAPAPAAQGSAPTPPAVARVARVAIAGENGALAVGRTLQLSAKVLDTAGAELSGRAVSWSSSDSTVAAVSQVGAVTGRKAGTATISANSEGRTGTARVQVTAATADLPAPVMSLRLGGVADRTLDPGGTVQLDAEALDGKGKTLDGRTVVWNSSNPSVATVSSTGLVTAVGPGTAAIVVSSEGRETRTNFTVNPRKPAPVASLAIAPASLTLDVGGSGHLDAAARDDRGQELGDRAVTWKSSDDRVARVDQRGEVAAVAKGTATLTASAEGKSANATVTVNEVVVVAASVTISAPDQELNVGETARWSAVAKDPRGKELADRTITWSSSAPRVASVAAGVVTGIAAGTSEIVAMVDGKRASETVTVKAPAPVAVAPPPQPGPGAAPAAASFLPKRSVQAGGGLSCGIGDRGAVCWGAGTATPGVVSGTAGMTSLSVGRGFACGILPGGEAACWGDNKLGQLGDGSQSPSPTPVAVGGGLRFSAIAAGTAHACGLADGKIWCWGKGKNGQLGEGGTADRRKPIQVRSKESFTALSAGDSHTCALNAAGKAFCWGDGFSGQLGFGSTDQQSEPVAVSGSTRYTEIAAGGKHTCAIATSGKAWCWGANESGQLGDGSKNDRTSPVAVTSGEEFTAVSAGTAHTCGVTSAGDLVCWGENKSGQLGDGSNKNSLKPVAIPATGRFRSVSAGSGHSCALSVAGEALCWGSNAQGQLGDGGTEARSTPGPLKGN